MPDSNKMLLVPMKVEALVIDADVIKNSGIFEQPDKSKAWGNEGKSNWIPAGSDYRAVTNSLDNAGPAPFLNLLSDQIDARLPLPDSLTEDQKLGDCHRGAYLHWVLPTGMRRGQTTATEQISFPSLPDQWLVVRFQRSSGDAKPTLKAWFIDSGVKSSKGESTQTASLLTPDPEAKEFTVTSVGKSVLLDRYKAEDFATEHRVPDANNCVGNDHTGSPTFTASVVDNRNVLSWHDSLDDLKDSLAEDPEAVPDGTTLSYLVVGWYQSADHQPLAVIGQVLSKATPGGSDKTVTADAILDQLSWQLGHGDASKPPDDLVRHRCVFHGMVTHINYWDSKAYGGGVLGHPGSSPVHSSVAGNSNAAPKAPAVSVGNNAADALVALVAEQTQADAGNNPELWRLLEAAIYRKLPTLNQDFQDPIVEHAVHQQWFSQQQAGFRWRIQAMQRDPNSLLVPVDKATDQSGATPAPKATQQQLDTLHQLNQTQSQLNQHARDLIAAQHDLYARWWTLAQKSRTTDISLGDDSGPLDQAKKLCGEFATAVEKHQSDLDHAHQTRQTHYESLRQQLAGSGLELRHESEPRFYHPSEPVLIFQNVGHQTKHHQPTKTVCRLGGQTTRELNLQIGRDQDVQSITAAADVSQLQKTIAKHFPGVQQTLSELLSEAVAVEESLTQLACQSRAKQTDWGPWLQRVQGALAWDGTGDGPADRIYFQGHDKAGAASVSRLASLWCKQPWTPLYLDWQISVYKSEEYSGDPSDDPNGGFGSGWHFDNYEYKASGTQSCHAKLQLQSLQGRSLMAPMMGRYLTDPIDELIAGLNEPAADEGINPLEASQQMRDLLSNYADSWKAQLEELASDGLLGQTLSGFHQTYLRRTQLAPSARPNAQYRWVKEGDHNDAEMDQKGCLRPPGNLLPGGQTMQLPALAPHTSQDMPKTSFTLPFHLIRSGTFVIEHLRIVDDFGQWIDIALSEGPGSELRTSPHAQVPDHGGHTALPPRIVQPTRFHFRFASRDFQDESNQHPKTHPVCGWVIHNFLDQALMVYQPDGKLLGEVVIIDEGNGQSSARWESLVYPPPEDTGISGVQEPTLRAFVQNLVSDAAKQRQPLQDLLSVIDHGLAKIRPTSSNRRYRICGRPLALINAQLGLHLFGNSWQDPGDEAAKPVMAPTGTGDPALDRLRIPVQLGQPKLREDGLIGYFIRKTAGGTTADAPDMTRFVPVRMPTQGHGAPASTGYLADPKTDGVRISYADHAHVTLLMDPHGAVHGATGIVPTKSITPPAEWLAEAKENLELSFRVAPVLRRKPLQPPPPKDSPSSSKPVISISAPAGFKGQWHFHGSAPGDDYVVSSPAIKPDFGDTVPQALEGRLVLRQDPKKK